MLVNSIQNLNTNLIFFAKREKKTKQAFSGPKIEIDESSHGQ